MARRARGWSDFDTDEKLEALREDVNVALDKIEELTKAVENLTQKVNRMSRGLA